MTQRILHALPRSNRFGGPGWLSKSGGVLTYSQCAHGLLIATNQQLRNIWERLTPFIHRVQSLDGLPALPSSRLTKMAQEAALDQSPELLAHGYRSALFACALAHIDKIKVDFELLYVCGLLHDVGLMTAVTGEDFTLRSAAVARRCACESGESPEVADHLADALITHTTVGISPDRDGCLGSYTQYGAMVDLTGLRLTHLPRAFVADVLNKHPRGMFKREILAHLDREAAAVKGGRFVFAKRVGLDIAVRYSPFPS